jgi:acyl carrier protein
MNPDGLIQATSVDSLKSWLIAWLAGEQGVEPETIDPSQTFLSYGMDSVQAMSLVGDLETMLRRRLPPTLAWDYPTIDALAQHLEDRLDGESGAVSPGPRARVSPEAARAEVESLLAEIDTMSDHDVDRLLTEYLGKS